MPKKRQCDDEMTDLLYKFEEVVEMLNRPEMRPDYVVAGEVCRDLQTKLNGMFSWRVEEKT